MSTCITIEESGLIFGPFHPNNCFWIEKDQTFLSINDHAKENEGIKLVEFLLLKQSNNFTTISLIEAKKSAPHPGNEKDYNNYISKLKEKFSNSLAIFFSFRTQRYLAGYNDLPSCFQQVDLATVKFELILVIPNADLSGLTTLTSDLQKCLQSLVSLWNLSATSIKVFNKELAIAHNLVN